MNKNEALIPLYQDAAHWRTIAAFQAQLKSRSRPKRQKTYGLQCTNDNFALADFCRLVRCHNDALAFAHHHYRPPSAAQAWLAALTLMSMCSSFAAQTLNPMGTALTALGAVEPSRLSSAQAYSLSTAPIPPSIANDAGVMMTQFSFHQQAEEQLAAFFAADEKRVEANGRVDRDFLVKRVIEYMRHRPAEAGTLARLVLSVESRRTLLLVANDQDFATIVNHWLGHQLFAGSIANFIIQQTALNRYHQAHILYLLERKLETKTANYIGADKEYLLTQVIGPEFPWIDAGSVPGEEKKSARWIMSYAGLTMANRLGINVANVDAEEAYAMGVMIYISLNENIISPEFLKLFSLPAIIAYIRLHPAQAIHWPPEDFAILEASALNYFIDQAGAQDTENRLLLLLNASLNQFKNRTQLGEASGVKDTEQLDRIYYQQNEDIANKSFDLDMLIINKAFMSLDPDDKKFIDGSRISVGGFALVYARRREPTTLFFPALPYDKDRLSVLTHADNVDIFRAENDDETRTYALQGVDGKYVIKRVDNDVELYGGLLTDEGKNLFNEAFTLELALTPMIGPGNNETVGYAITRYFAQHHQKKLKKRLDTLGYDITGMEKARAVFLSLIPFYQCLQSTAKGEGGEAIFDCGLDIVGLIPMAGQAAKVSVRVGQTLARGGLVTGRNALMRAGARNSLRRTLKETIALAGKDFLRHGIKPMSDIFTRNQLISLALATTRGLDPGVELIFLLSKNSASHILHLGRLMKHTIPGLSTLIRKCPGAERLAAKGARTGGRRVVMGPPERWVPVMEMNVGNAVPNGQQGRAATRDATNLVWQPLKLFMPIYNFQIDSTLRVNSRRDALLMEAFDNKPYVLIEGLEHSDELIAHPYLSLAQEAITLQIDNIFKMVDHAKSFVLSTSGNRDKREELIKYFCLALGVDNAEVAHMAIIMLDDVLSRIMRAKQSLRKRIVLASSARKINEHGRYPSLLNLDELAHGDLGFCVPGDKHKRIYLIVDRLLDYYDKDSEIHHVILHEITHSVASSEDTFYLGSVAMRAEGGFGPLKEFNDKLAAKTLNLGHIKYKLVDYLKLPHNQIISDDTIYRALAHDAVFKANMLMLNADTLVKFIEDLSLMHAPRTTRDVRHNSINSSLVDQVLLTLLLRTIIQ